MLEDDGFATQVGNVLSMIDLPRAQVHAAHVRGMGAKAMLVLATLAAEPELLHVLRALLQPRDYACLVHIAHRAVRLHHACTDWA